MPVLAVCYSRRMCAERWPPLWAVAAWKNQTEIRHGDYRNSAVLADLEYDYDGDDDDNGAGCSRSADCCYRLAIESYRWPANRPLCNCYVPDRETWVQRRL